MAAAAFPARCPVSDRSGILQALERDGCAVVTGLGEVEDWRAVATALPEKIFGKTLLPGEPQVAGVHEEHAAIDAKSNNKEAVLSGAPLLPHTDGYIYGNHLPDYIMLLVECQSLTGGESFVIDGKAVLKRLEGSTSYPLLTTMDVDLSEKVATGGQVDGRDAVGPMFQTGPRKRLQWRRQVRTDAKNLFWSAKDPDSKGMAPYQSLWAPLQVMGAEERTKCQEMLDAVDVAVQEEAAIAPRFKVTPGDALLIDNWRMLHARDGFPFSSKDQPRRLWRVWTWTKDSPGLPDGIAMTSTIEDAQMVRGEGDEPLAKVAKH